MKLIQIQRHFFRLQDEPNKVWFCTEAETDQNLNVTVVRYIRASKSMTLPENWQSTRTQELRGNTVSKNSNINLKAIHNPFQYLLLMFKTRYDELEWGSTIQAILQEIP